MDKCHQYDIKLCIVGIQGWRDCTGKVSYKEELVIKLDVEGWARYGYPQFWVEVGSKIWVLWEQCDHKYGGRKVRSLYRCRGRAELCYQCFSGIERNNTTNVVDKSSGFRIR